MVRTGPVTGTRSYSAAQGPGLLFSADGLLTMTGAASRHRSRLAGRDVMHLAFFNERAGLASEPMGSLSRILNDLSAPKKSWNNTGQMHIWPWFESPHGLMS